MRSTKQERPALPPLPAGLCPCFHEARRSVHRDGYVEPKKALTRRPRSRSVASSGSEAIQNCSTFTPCLCARSPCTRSAEFTRLKTWGEFDGWSNRIGSRKDIHELAAGHFPRKGTEGLFLVPPGVGTTPLAHVVGYEAIEQGCVARYRSTFDVVADFRSEEALQQRNKTLPRSFQADLLIIDDMGFTQLPKHASEHLFEIIMRRDENKSTLVTRTRPTEDWGDSCRTHPPSRRPSIASRPTPSSSPSPARATGIRDAVTTRQQAKTSTGWPSALRSSSVPLPPILRPFILRVAGFEVATTGWM